MTVFEPLHVFRLAFGTVVVVHVPYRPFCHGRHPSRLMARFLFRGTIQRNQVGRAPRLDPASLPATLRLVMKYEEFSRSVASNEIEVCHDSAETCAKTLPVVQNLKRDAEPDKTAMKAAVPRKQVPMKGRCDVGRSGRDGCL